MSTTPRITFIGLYNYDSTLFQNLTLPAGVDKTTAIITFLRTYGECPTLYTDPDFIKTMLGIWSVQNEEPIARIYRALTEEYNPLHNFDRHEEYSDSETSSETASHTGSETTSYSGSETTAYTGSETTEYAGSETTAYTGSDVSSEQFSESSTTSETTENTISAFNASTYQPDNKQERSSEVETERENDRNYERDLLDTINRDLEDTHTRNLSDTHTRNLSDTLTRNLSDGKNGNRLLKHVGHLYGNIGVTKSQEMAIDEVELRMKYDIYGVIADMLHRDFCLYLY